MTTERREIEVIVAADDAGSRADVMLGRRVPALSRRMAKRLALDGHVRVRGRRAAPSRRVQEGERWTVSVPAKSNIPPPMILRATDLLLYVNKPPGIHTVAKTPGEPGCLATMVAALHPECVHASEDPREGGAVHRLDRDTSGIIAFARDRETWQRAREGFSAGAFAKMYVARCTPPGVWPPAPPGALPGWVDEASEPWDVRSAGSDLTAWGRPIRIRAALGRAAQRGKITVRLDGQRATSHIQRLTAPKRMLRSAAMAVRLETGVRHQARVHLAWAASPIDGDQRYGGRRGLRLYLHASALDLSDRFSDEEVVHCPPPAGFFDDSAAPPAATLTRDTLE